MNPNITLTPAATDYIKKMIEKDQGIGFKLSIKKTGCSGFSYVPTIVTDVKTTDIQVETQGINLILDPVWMHLLEGIQIDYIDEDKTGLKQKRLVFSNPKESGRCGCGESFHI